MHEGGNPAEGYNNGPRQMGPPFFRGRAIPRGAFRGTIRGRGRGGFFPNGRGGFVNGPPARGVELSQEESKEEGSSKLAMDREYELAEARDKARAAAATTAPESTSSPAPPTVEDASAKQVQEQGQAAGETPAVSAPVQPAVASSERKWGHEGYEAMTAPASGHLRGAYRGRVRGAGARGRGVFFRMSFQSHNLLLASTDPSSSRWSSTFCSSSSTNASRSARSRQSLRSSSSTSSVPRRPRYPSYFHAQCCSSDHLSFAITAEACRK